MAFGVGVDYSNLGNTSGMMPSTSTMATGAAGLIGAGFEAYGAYESFQGAKASNTATIGQIGTEMQEDYLRKLDMEMQARRSSMEGLRNAQQAGAQALANAAGKGALQGSGLQGGKGQIAGQSAYIQSGISQKLQSGEQMYNYKMMEDQYKIQAANAQMKMQEGSAFGTIGKDIVGAASAIGPWAALALA